MSEMIRAAAKNKKPEAKRENKVSKTQNIANSQSISSPVEQTLFFQRTIGNQAVGRLIKSGALQAKLRIGQPGDIYEQEEPVFKSFENCLMVKANFTDAKLSKTRLAGTVLTGANLVRADFSRADLSNAVLFGANIKGTVFINANMENVSW